MQLNPGLNINNNKGATSSEPSLIRSSLLLLPATSGTKNPAKDSWVGKFPVSISVKFLNILLFSGEKYAEKSHADCQRRIRIGRSPCPDRVDVDGRRSAGSQRFIAGRTTDIAARLVAGTAESVRSWIRRSSYPSVLLEHERRRIDPSAAVGHAQKYPGRNAARHPSKIEKFYSNLKTNCFFKWPAQKKIEKRNQFGDKCNIILYIEMETASIKNKWQNELCVKVIINNNNNNNIINENIMIRKRRTRTYTTTRREFLFFSFWILTAK